MERAPLDLSRLRAELGARWPRITVVAETGSTNADLLSEAPALDRTVLAAEFQTSGRGRLDRAWASPRRAGLTFSVFLRPAAPLARWGWLPLLTGVAVVNAVTAAGLSAARLKWPNDVLVGPAENKLAGILAQAREGEVVIGVGLNVTTTAEELAGTAGTSLALAGIASDRTELLIGILTELDSQLARWDDVAGQAAACGLAAAYRDMCSTVGREVRILGTDGSDLLGTAVDVDDEGHLLLQTGEQIRVVAAGDVRHARPKA